MTQENKILELLRSQSWVSTVDAVNIYILRLGAIIFSLKKKGYVIESRRVEGKSFNEYHLVSEPKMSDDVGNGGISVSDSSIQEVKINESMASDKQVSPAFGEGDLLHLRETSGVQGNGRGTFAGENRQCGNLF